MRRDQAGAAKLFDDGVERSSDEDCAWAKAVTGPEGEKERWLETALSLRPRFARALVERGQCRRNQGDGPGPWPTTTRRCDSIHVTRRHG
ncbi:MAG: hypothetical protein HYZ53_00330 [Planctomycetes bacterium]|nr:hypothetical protein [Planctomycetota bacterium]